MINNSLQLKGKKLLILGGAPNEVPIVLRAQSMGIYVIVTDMYIDHNVSPAKDIADEYWDISWSDIGKLKEKCSVECVDGVLGGFSEIKIESQIAVSYTHLDVYKRQVVLRYVNGQWVQINGVVGDGNVTVTVDGASPIAFYVLNTNAASGNNGANGANGTDGSKVVSPKTGSAPVMMCVVAVAVAAAAGMCVTSRRKHA